MKQGVQPLMQVHWLRWAQSRAGYCSARLPTRASSPAKGDPQPFGNAHKVSKSLPEGPTHRGRELGKPGADLSCAAAPPRYPSSSVGRFHGCRGSERRGEHAETYQACKDDVDAGDAECQVLVGYLFQQGLGVPANATEAIRLFRLAAKRGLASAQCSLGFAYEQGLGVTRDDVAAARWYQLAAAQGDPIGEYHLAILLAAGRGIAQDRVKAVELLRHAADRGYAEAQILLALGLEAARKPLPAYI